MSLIDEHVENLSDDELSNGQHESPDNNIDDELPRLSYSANSSLSSASELSESLRLACLRKDATVSLVRLSSLRNSRQTGDQVEDLVNQLDLSNDYTNEVSTYKLCLWALVYFFIFFLFFFISYFFFFNLAIYIFFIFLFFHLLL